MVPCQIVPWVDETMHQAGVEALLSNGPRGRSLVDCASVLAMRQEGIVDALAPASQFAVRAFGAMQNRPRGSAPVAGPARGRLKDRCLEDAGSWKVAAFAYDMYCGPRRAFHLRAGSVWGCELGLREKRYAMDTSSSNCRSGDGLGEDRCPVLRMQKAGRLRVRVGLSLLTAV